MRAAAPWRPAAGPSSPRSAETVFDDANSAYLAAADTTHWWFRGKADIVGALLHRWATVAGWLVDVGAGSGGVTAMLPWDGSRRLAIEGSTPLVARAAQRGMGALQGDVSNLPIRGGSAAAVCLLDVIEHLPYPVDALREARRVVAPGGIVVVSVPAHMWLWSAADESLGHYRRYRRTLLEAELAQSGLQALWVSHAFSWCVPPVWVARKVMRRSPEAELGISDTSPTVDRVAGFMNRMERKVLARTTLPIGTSVIAVAGRLEPDAQPTGAL